MHERAVLESCGIAEEHRGAFDKLLHLKLPNEALALVIDAFALKGLGAACECADEVQVRPNVKLTGVRQRAAAGPK